MGLSEVLKGMQTYKEKSLFPGCAGTNLCIESLTLTPTIFMSKSFEWLNLFLIYDKTLDALSHRLFFNFPNSFCFTEASLWISAKHTPATFLIHRQHFLVYTEFRAPPFRGNLFAVCHTFLLTLIHMVIWIRNVDFSFYTRAELRSYRVASHVNTCTPVRYPGSAAC